MLIIGQWAGGYWVLDSGFLEAQWVDLGSQHPFLSH